MMEQGAKHSGGKRYGVTFFVMSAIVVAWQCYVLALDTQLGGVSSLLQHWHVVAVNVANALLLLSPYWLLPRRWRWVVWLPLTLLTVWCMAQLCYCRAYDDLMPWHSLTLTQNVNSTLAASTMSLLRWQDLLVVLPYLALIAVCAAGLEWSPGRDVCRTRAFLVTILAAVLVGAAGYLDGDTNYERRFLHNFGGRNYFARNGMIPYVAFTLHEEFKAHSVTDEEREQVKQFMATECPRYSDNRYCRVDGRNLVLIIVESLHTWPIGMRVDGREVTPELNRLIAQEGTIYAPHVLFQTSHGHSSDAHFIYNTGLLPLRDGVVAVSHGDGPYPTLADALSGYDCREVICTPSVNWNQAMTARTYGFDTLYTRDDLVASGALSRHGGIDDAALTDFTSSLLPRLIQPFFLELVTMTMHAPYPAGKVPRSWITAADTLNAEARGYLECVHVTDSCIGSLVKAIRDLGIERNTVVAIVSDHTQLYLNRIKGIPDREASPVDWGIPLIIAGADTTCSYLPVIGQIDVFPTLIDVMGVNEYWWKGLGHSLLRYPVTSAIQPRNMSVIGDSSRLTDHQRRAWDISRLMILDRKQASVSRQVVSGH